MADREQQLEHALSLILTANHALHLVRQQRGNQAAEDTRRAAVRDFARAIEHARNLLAQGRVQAAPARRREAWEDECCGQTMAEGYRCAGCPHARPTDRLIPRRAPLAAPKEGE